MPRFHDRATFSEDGEPVYARVPFTPEEEERADAEAAADAAAHSAEVTATEERQALLKAARVPETIMAKLRSGSALTPDEMQTVVRWLAISAASGAP